MRRQLLLSYLVSFFCMQIIQHLTYVALRVLSLFLRERFPLGIRLRATSFPIRLFHRQVSPFLNPSVRRKERETSIHPLNVAPYRCMYFWRSPPIRFPLWESLENGKYSIYIYTYSMVWERELCGLRDKYPGKIMILEDENVKYIFCIHFIGLYLVGMIFPRN